MDDTGELEVTQRGVPSKEWLRDVLLDRREFGAFRSLGVYFPLIDKVVFPRPDNKDIVLYVTGAEYRMNVFEDFTRFDPEWFGIMSARPGAADPQGGV